MQIYHCVYLVKAGADYFPLLEGKSNRKTILSVYDPNTKKRFEETIKPITYAMPIEIILFASAQDAESLLQIIHIVNLILFW